MSTLALILLVIPCILILSAIALGLAAFVFACICFVFDVDTNDRPIFIARTMLYYAIGMGSVGVAWLVMVSIAVIFSVL